MNSHASLFPLQGSKADLRNWMINTLMTTLSNPPDLEQLKQDLSNVDITPHMFSECPLDVATFILHNWRYAAYCLVMLPTTPGNSNYQNQAWDVVVSFHRSDIVI